MKKIIIINGSPRKNKNTHQMLLEVERGAREMGAETEVVHLYDLQYTDCKSCFACKRRGNKTNGVCALRDGLRPVLEKIADADGVIIGSPVYYGNLTGQVLSFINRMLYPVAQFELDPATGKMMSMLRKPKRCALIVTMNASEEYLKQSPMIQTFENMSGMIGMVLGSCETLYSCDTLQYNDYSQYYAGLWDEAAKRHQHETQFPVDLKNAYELGKRVAQQ